MRLCCQRLSQRCLWFELGEALFWLQDQNRSGAKSLGVKETRARDISGFQTVFPALCSGFNSSFQIRVHPRRVHPDHRVHLPDGHSGGDSQKVRQPHLLHPVLPKPLHDLALGGHRGGLPGHAALHGGVDQRVGSSEPPRCEGEEGGVTTDWLKCKVVETIRSFFYSCTLLPQ